MSDLVSALRDFLRRDIAILLGGGTVILAFLYSFDRLPSDSPSLLLGMFLAGASYVVGFALQSLCEFLHIAVTLPLRTLGPFRRSVYRRLTRRDWKDVPQELDFQAIWFGLTDVQRAHCERTIGLKMLGSACGPGAVVASALLFIRYRTQHDLFDQWLASACLVVGIALLVVGPIKAAQQAQFYEEAHRLNSKLAQSERTIL